MIQKSPHRLEILLCFGLLLCFLGNVFAFSEKKAPPPWGSSIYYKLSVGTGFTSLGKTTDLVLTNAIINRYVANRANKMVVLFGGGIGYRFRLSHPVAMSLGVAFYQIEWGSYGGVLHPAFNLNPGFDALNYSYDVSSSLLWAEQYWLFGSGHWKPFLFLGVGVSWNRVFEYSEKAADPNGSAAPTVVPFHSGTSCYLSYGVGGGIRYLLSNNKTQISLGYRYIDLNQGKLGTTPLQTTTERLASGKLYAHLLILSVLFQ